MAAIAPRRPSRRRPHFSRASGSALRDRRPLTWCFDASVVIQILVKEPGSAAVDAFMSTHQQEVWISDFAAAEVASAVLRLVRTGRLQASEGIACLSDFDVWRTAMTREAEMHAADV